MRKNLDYALKKIVPLILAGMMFAGCGTYGKIKRDDKEVMPYFESGIIAPNKEYRQSPCGSNPAAILNFPKSSLDSKLWSCPVLNSEELKTKVSKIQENASQDETDVGGAYVLDDKGNKIGQVYGNDSYLKSNPTVWIKDNNKFSIQTPGMKSSGGSSPSSTGSSTSGGGAGGAGGSALNIYEGYHFARNFSR
jgi:hypothetical protein